MIRQYTQLMVLCAVIGSVYLDTNYRLNTSIKPSSYAISITPYFDTADSTAFTFDGEVIITFTTDVNTNKIKLHSQDLNFTSSYITLSSDSGLINLNSSNPLDFEEIYSFAHINLATFIVPGVEYFLRIAYRGPIRSDLNGFYRNYYVENGIKKWLGATQMEPTHARKVFPCFDEPELKAEFVLTIDRPKNYKPTLANTKQQSRIELSNGYIREIFYPTPRMSTYLVAFLVSEMEAGESIVNGTNEFGVYSRPDATNQTEYAFDFGLRVVKALGNYFGIDYYSTNQYLKLDHIALPNFKAGAMENWGLIKYRESLLLYVPEESTPYFKYRVAQIVAHETTHMWFGNLVTCHWWSNTWLNEGFANYFQDYITYLIEPNVTAGDMLVIGSVHSALSADEDPDSPAITNNNVNSPAEISGHFGTITYQKAGSVIRMIHHLIGDEAFKFGLNLYLTKNQFGSGYPDNIYSGLSDGVAKYSSMSTFNNSNITSIMTSWVSQAGYPVLNVEVNYEDSTILLKQKRFYIDSSQSSGEIYKIPITYTTNTTFDFENTKPDFIMDDEYYVLQIQGLDENRSWPIFNIQETGLYRVNYDDHTWQRISEQLKGQQREKIHYLNRAKIVNDLFAFLYADEVTFDLLNNVLHFLENETEYAVWYAAIRGLSKLRNHYLGSDILSLIDDFALHLMNNIVNELGYEVRASDDFNTRINRMQVLEFACKLGHEGCLEKVLAIYEDFKNNGTWIDPSLRSAAYCTGLRFGNGNDYDFLWSRMSSTNIANEAKIIGDILGCTSDNDKLNSYLVSMLVENSPIQIQDLSVPLTSVLANYSNVNVVLDNLQKNESLWQTIYSSMDSVLPTIASALHTQEDFDKFDAWLSSCSICNEQDIISARSALSKVKKVTSWADSHKEDIRKTFKNDGKNLSSSILILAVAIITVFFLQF